MVEKGITVAADKLHQVTKEAKRPWTADDAIRYASGVMARSQEELEKKEQMAQAQGRTAARLAKVNGPEASQTTTVSEKNDV